MPPLERQQTVLTILQNLCDLDGLKTLFWEELNYQRQNKPLGVRDWPSLAKKALEKLVPGILAAKKADREADVSGMEREIDQIVYRLYGLTAEEIRIVEGG